MRYRRLVKLIDAINNMFPKRLSAGQKSLTWPYIVALSALFLLAYASGGWWFAQTAAKQQKQDAVAQAESLAAQLSSSVEPLLASGELSSVRRLLTEVGYQRHMADCKLLLSDGRPLVDSDLDKPQLTVLPAIWPKGQAQADETRVIGGQILVDKAIPVPGKGEATLSLSMPLPESMALIQPALPGAALIGVCALGGGLVVLRKLRERLAILTLIRDALRDAGDGIPDMSALSLNPGWGKEAEGWNRLLMGQQVQDFTKIQQTLEALNMQNQGGALEDACEGLTDGLLLTDSMGRAIYLNGAAAAHLQIDADQAEGLQLLPLITDESLAEQVEQVLSGSGPGRVTHEIQRGEQGEENTLRVTIKRLRESGGMIMTLEDVTQQRVAEAARHDFVNRATHELRTPLTNIRLYVETAQTDGEDDKELRGECLNVISRESQRLERLVNEMLSVSEIEAGSMTMRKDDVRLDQLFKSLQQDYSANASQKQIELRFDLPPKLPAIQGDRDRLSIVLQNLLGNAIKYTPDGGEVSVGVDLSATELSIEVRDSGIGISEEDQQHVFEKFYRANDPRLGDITGSGLGLALAHEIVRLHGGELTVESVLNEGSTFRLVLPVIAEGV